jgi:hypothetical protein
MQRVLETFRGRGTLALLMGCMIPAAAAVFAWLMELASSRQSPSLCASRLRLCLSHCVSSPDSGC